MSDAFARDLDVHHLRRLRDNDRERYLCALSAPRPAQGALLALLAFNQELAEACDRVSEPMLGHIKLQWWINQLPAILQNRPPAHPVAEALARVSSGAGLQDCEGALIALAQARTFDLQPGRPATLAELQDYAYATGGAVQALMVDILGVDDAPTRQAARDVGAAWALVGLMRALPYRRAARAGGGGAGGGGAGTRDMLPQHTTVPAVLEQAEILLAQARGRALTKPKVRAALPALQVARLADRHLARLKTPRLKTQNQASPPVPEPPLGARTVLSIWSGKLTGRF